METSSPDSSVASTEAAVATPATPAPSASASIEASSQPVEGQAPALPAAQPELAQSGESVAAPSDDLPDDNAFEQLPGSERASNWAKARARIAELNQQVAQFQQNPPPQPEQVERWQQQAELAESLFSPLVGENGEQMLDEQGLPVYTAEPFIERLVAESPSTFGEIMWKGFDQPNPLNPSETIGHVFLRDRLGLDPALLDTYQQIKSAADAKSYLSQSGQVSPDELASIPANYHDAYKSLTPELRDEVQLMSDVARDQYLAERQELLETRKFREEQQAERQRQETERQQAFQAQVAQRGQALAQESAQRSFTAAREKLKAEANFSADEGVNSAVWDEILNTAASKVINDPLLGKDNAQAERLYHLSAHYEANGDKYKAVQARVEADKLATKLDARFRNEITQRTAFWSKALGAARSAQQQQLQNAQPRVEIAANGNASPQTPRVNPQAPQGQRYGLTPAEINQMAAELAMRRTGQA